MGTAILQTIHSQHVVDNLYTLRAWRNAHNSQFVSSIVRDVHDLRQASFQKVSTRNWTLIKDRCTNRDLYSGTLAIERAGIPLNQRLLSANIARRLEYIDDALRLASRRVSSRRCAVCCGIARRAILATILLCYLKRQRPWTSPLSSASPAWRPDICLPVPQSPWTCSWGS